MLKFIKVMSRIGKLPITLPEGVTIEQNGGLVTVKGPKGELVRKFASVIAVKQEGSQLEVTVKDGSENAGAMHGTSRAILQNMVTGVKDGWSKKLELVGTGYRAEVSGGLLTLAIGYSHPVKFDAPAGISFKVEKTDITIEGPDREVVGQTAARIRAVRPPEPYKGKGIKYKDEVIRRKAGKAAKAAGSA